VPFDRVSRERNPTELDSLPVASQIRAVLSADAVTTRSPEASNVAVRTGSSCCSFLPIGSPVRASQIRAVLLADAVTTRSPFASNVAQ